MNGIEYLLDTNFVQRARSAVRQMELLGLPGIRRKKTP